MIVKGGKWVPLLDKGKVVVSPRTDGCVVGVMERSNSFDDGFLPSLDLEVFLGVKPILLNSFSSLEYEKCRD